MNIHEEKAWKVLLQLGAKATTLDGKQALDLRPIRLTSEDKLSLFCSAYREVVGRSNANRWHQNRRGQPVFVVTDFPLDADIRTCPECGRPFAMLHICENCGRCDDRDPTRNDVAGPCCRGRCKRVDWRKNGG